MVRKSQTKSRIKTSAFSLVVPVYNEEECLEHFLQEAKIALNSFKDWEMILVDDGSTDQSWSIISRHALKDKKVRGIRFTRNFGHQHAVLAGLRATQFSYIGIIDADPQANSTQMILPEEKWLEIYGPAATKKSIINYQY